MMQANKKKSYRGRWDRLSVSITKFVILKKKEVVWAKLK